MGRRLGSLLAVPLLVTAACSGGSGDDADDAGARPSSSTTTTAPRFTGDPGSPFCVLLREVRLDDVLDEEAATPDEVAAAYATVIEALGRLTAAAPPELEEDTALVEAGMIALDDALRAVGYRLDTLAADPELAVEVSRAANDPAFAVASARIEAYREQVCGL